MKQVYSGRVIVKEILILLLTTMSVKFAGKVKYYIMGFCKFRLCQSCTDRCFALTATSLYALLNICSIFIVLRLDGPDHMDL